MAREDLVLVNARFREPCRVRLWHFGHWIVIRDDKGQNSLEIISQTIAIRL